MRDRLIFAFYLISLVAITFVHDIGTLIAGVGIVALLTGRNFLKIAKRVAVAVVIFNSIVTISYGVMSLIHGAFSLYYVVLINIRVFLLTSLTFAVTEWIDPFKVIGSSRALSSLFVITYSQVRTLLRLYEEFRMSLRSRSPSRLSIKDLYRHNASMITSLLEKSVANTTEITHAMKSRGFFND